MVGPGQTPASRRFLPPTSISRASNNTSSSQKSSFARYPHSSSSSPFPRIALPKKTTGADEIQTSFEDEDEAEFALPSVSRTTSSSILRKTCDYIEHDVNEERMDDTQSPKISTATTTFYNRKGSEHNYDDTTSSPTADFSSPLPKRQKVTHFDRTSRPAIEISSSLSDSNGRSPESTELEAAPDHSSGDFGLDIIDKDAIEDVNEEHAARHKFRIRFPVDDTRTHETERASTRSAFKSTHATAPHWLETPLPATFTPSKRKGRYEYVSGGAAETVRNWVLDVASEQSRSTQNTSQTFRIAGLATDPSGRFDMVDDENGQRWMLVHQEAHKDALHDLGDRLRPNAVSVSVKGVGTSWSIELPDASGSEQLRSHNIHVAALWELAHSK